MSDTLYLVFELGGQRVAIASEIVDSVVHVVDIVPAPLAPPHIAGLAALRSRVITMVDARAALGLEPVTGAGVRVTVVVTLDGHQYGLIVDRVDDVCAIPGDPAPVRARLGAGWSRAASAMLEHDGASLLLLDPAALIAGARAEAA